MMGLRDPGSAAEHESLALLYDWEHDEFRADVPCI